MKNWYTYDNILKYEADFYLVLSGRSNGKSFAMKKMMIDNYFNSNETEQFVLVRRYAQDIKQKISQSYFGDMTEYLADTYHAKIKLYQGTWYVKDLDEPDSGIKNAKPIGFNVSVSECERIKGSSYPNVTLICYEEFMAFGNRYLSDELSLFNNIVSTIVRKRTNVKIFLIGNTLSSYNPFTNELSVDIKKLAKNSITPIDKYPNSERWHYVIERGESVKIDNNVEQYYIFKDSSKQGSVIENGDFETGTYPLERKGVTIDDMKPYHNYYFFYLKVGLDWFMLYKGMSKTLTINPMWEQWKKEQEEEEDDDWLYYTFSNVDLEEPEPPKMIETLDEEILGFEQVEEPNEYMKKHFKVVIFNVEEDIKDTKCYKHIPTDNNKFREIIIEVINHAEQNWLVYPSHSVGESVTYGLSRL